MTYRFKPEINSCKFQMMPKLEHDSLKSSMIKMMNDCMDSGDSIQVAIYNTSRELSIARSVVLGTYYSNLDLMNRVKNQRKFNKNTE